MVNEEMTPQEYSFLDWNGSPLMEKINKSQLGGSLSRPRQRLENRFFLASFVKSLFSSRNDRLLLSWPDRLARVRCAVRYLLGFVRNGALSAKK